MAAPRRVRAGGSSRAEASPGAGSASRRGVVSRPLGRSVPAGDGGEVLSYEQVAEIQRSRLLAVAVRAIEELGYTRATVAHITRRARVSRRTFYELFANREECLA